MCTFTRGLTSDTAFTDVDIYPNTRTVLLQRIEKSAGYVTSIAHSLVNPYASVISPNGNVLYVFDFATPFGLWSFDTSSGSAIHPIRIDNQAANPGQLFSRQ